MKFKSVGIGQVKIYDTPYLIKKNEFSDVDRDPFISLPTHMRYIYSTEENYGIFRSFYNGPRKINGEIFGENRQRFGGTEFV